MLFRGLYQGIGSVIIATVPSSGAFFTTYEFSKLHLNRLNESLPSSLPQPVVHAAASSIAELVSCFILTPAEVLKQNAQVVSNPARSSSSSQSTSLFPKNATMAALRKFNRPSQLWRGYTALAARNLPFTAMHFPLFEHLKSRLMKRRERLHPSRKPTLLERGLVTSLAAGTAGSIAAVITTPIDVVKTRIMLSASDQPNPHTLFESSDDVKVSTAKRKSGFQIGRDVLRDQGFRGLWRGGALRGAWTFLGSGLYLGAYDMGRIWLGQRRDGKKQDDEGIS